MTDTMTHIRTRYLTSKVDDVGRVVEVHAPGFFDRERWVRVFPLIDMVPYMGDPDNPLDPDWAEQCPMGQCPVHGLEGYRDAPFRYNTAYDPGETNIFLCGKVDLNGIF